MHRQIRFANIRPLIHAAKRVGARLLDQLYPPRCPGCRVRITPEERDDYEGWCAPCAGTVFVLDGPGCSVCAAPRPTQYGRVNPGIDSLCPRCSERRPSFERADSLYEYVGAVADAIQYVKYAPAPWPLRILEAPFSRWLVARIRSLDQPLLTTVPMHRRDLARRGFHPIELLLHRASGRHPSLETTRLLAKTRYTPPQAGLTLGERLRNVRGSFSVTSTARVSGQTIVLVDDVITTGATADATAKALLDAGASRVLVFTLARATRR